MKKELRVAIVGATGLVGQSFLSILEERKLPVSEYVLFASARSAGKEIAFMGKTYIVQELTEQSFDSGFDVALFSAGGSTSEKYAPIAAAHGCVVVDNSSQWRMDPEVPLVVPEVNPDDIKKHKGIIANPNCSTIQAVVALAPLHRRYVIRRIVYSTYQSVSGAGSKGWHDLENGIQAYVEGKEDYKLEKFPHPIFDNCLPHIDAFLDSGYTKEEIKMIEETRKILGEQSLLITATTVRVPVFSAHSESINVEFETDFAMDDVRKLLGEAPGVVLMDDPANNVYPLASVAAGTDPVYVGRLRRDTSIESGLNLWVVADNIRKGAALNAIQIVEKLIEFWQA